MLAKNVFFCYFSVTFSVLVAVTSSVDEDKFVIKTTTVSLTGSDTPFAYIEPLCHNNDTSTCRKFRCTALSRLETNIYWKFKGCENENCEFREIASDFLQDGLQVVSDINLRSNESGYLRCTANNSHIAIETFQEIVPFNQTGRRFILLEEENFDYNILPSEEIIEVRWKIHCQGHPFPDLILYANDNKVSDLPSKYNYFSTKNELTLKIKNASAQDADTQFHVLAQNIYENKTLYLSYNVADLKDVSIKTLSLNDTDVELECVAISIVPLKISWYSSPCLIGNCTYEKLTKARIEERGLQVISHVHVNLSQSGYLKCVAEISVDRREVYQGIEDIRNSFEKKSEESNCDLKNCGSSAHNSSDGLKWFERDDEQKFHHSRTFKGTGKFSNRESLDLAGTSSLRCKKWFTDSIIEYQKQKNKKRNKAFHIGYYFVIIVLLVIIAIIIVYVYKKMRSFKKLQKELEELHSVGLGNFEKGALEHLNPNLTIDDQADLLPYDKSYEFPSDQLKLGEQIGSGAFGVVVKGEAKGISEHEPVTTVAVKMVNRTIGDIYIKALASELKIMIHLGKHVNVVNLLGACTKNISKRELLVIVEYCRFGNLKDYLLNHRPSFIDQINSETGQIDFCIGSDVLESNTEFPYITPSFANQAYQAQVSSKSTTNTSETDVAPETESTENLHYKGDYHKINRPVCTRDLLLWSFQIARGMDYLSSRKVLHGDLAARNILLTDGNVVKICDFGLSKNMYQKDIYKKSGDEMLPVKWMAIEAITDKIFSVQSDVWSFGIVLWEMFSLARAPYPGIEYNESFCEKLLEGYRMKIPQFATQEIYEIMLHCWNAEPTLRPSFSQLVQKIGCILDETIREHYVDMNTGYLKMNAQKFRKQNEDYLSMISAPDFKKYSSPYRYVNIIESEGQEVNTYI